MIDFNILYQQCLENTQQYPAITTHLATQLGVSDDSILRLGIGFHPGKQVYVIPEKNSEGAITGLSYRAVDSGKKWNETGSVRGLVYVSGQQYTPGPQNWVRTSTEHPCPLCDKAGECLLSAENPNDPAAICCAHVETNAVKRLDTTWLHIRKPNHNFTLGTGTVLITEGFSDTAFALSLGYSAIGVPAAGAGVDLLKPLVKNHDIIIMSDADTVGRTGAQKIGKILRRLCPSIKIVTPPNGFDDLRNWKPNREIFDSWVTSHGQVPNTGCVIDRIIPMELTERFIKEKFQTGDNRLLHFYQGDRWNWDGNHYERRGQTWLNSQLFDYFGQFEIEEHKGKDVVLKSLVVNNYFLKDITTALESYCYLDVSEDVAEPFYIKSKQNLDLEYSIAFQNGILNVQTDKMQPLTPDIFLTSILPFGYDPKAQCPVWRWFVQNIFNSDQESINLLQEWAGYLLVPSNRLQAMMFFFGGKAAGKSTLVKILQEVLRGRHFSIDLESFISEFGLSPLVGKFALFVDEDRPIRKADNARIVNRIKKISGGDKIEIRRKYRDAVNIKPAFRITYSANMLPPLSDISGALMRRINLLYFPNDYSANPDRSLEERLTTEIPGIAIWCIEGLRRLLEKGDFTIPQISKMYLQEYQELTNPLKKLLDEHCEVLDPTTDPTWFDHWVTTKEMYDLVNTFFVEQGEDRISDSQLGLQLISALGGNRKTRISKGTGKNRERFHIYQGVRILQSGKEILMRAK